MDAQIRVSGGDAVTEYAALGEWLRGERELAGRVRVIHSPPEEGHLGGVLDMLSVALGSGGAVVAMTRSLVAWIQTRRPDVEITIGSPAGGAVPRGTARRRSPA